METRKKWLIALCKKYSYEVVDWFECEAEDIYDAVRQYQQLHGRINSSLNWFDGTEV